MSEDLNKAAIISNCRGEVLETLSAEFDEVAKQSGASALEVLVAAVAFTLTAAEFIPDRVQRAAILDSLVGASLP